jgi:hypothetical protein
MKADRLISQVFDYCPGKTPEVSTWSRNSALSTLMTNTFGVFVSKIQYLTYESIRMDSLVWEAEVNEHLTESMIMARN